MKNIIFKKISIQNFLSIGEDKLEVNFTKGINIITGSNIDKPDRRNGVGKSSVADALYFAIFGEPLRDIKKDFIINNITGGVTQVTVDFDIVLNNKTVTYLLTRTLNPSKVFITEDGVDVTRDTLSNTNKFICELLSATPSIFQNCVIMTVNNATPFMAKNKVEKRKFIEDIFGLEIFSNMLSELRSDYNETRKQLDIENAKLGELVNTINNYKTQRQKILDQRTNKLKLYKDRQEENSLQKTLIYEKLTNLTEYSIDDANDKILKLSSGITLCDERLSESISNLSQLQTNRTFLLNSLSKIGTDEHVCPVCLREIETQDIEHIKAEQQKIAAEVKQLQQQEESFKVIIAELKAKKDKINKHIKQTEQVVINQRLQNQTRQSLTEKLEQIDKWQVSLVHDIEQLSNSTTDFDKLIDETVNRFDELKSGVEKINHKFNTLDVVKYVISEEGVKSYIVNKLLNLLNNRLAYYLDKLDGNAVCNFNEYFEEEIVNDKNKVCSYFNFSGAERKAIDLACLFTFSDLRRLQGGVEYNIAMYDELFDSSFDEKGLEFVTDILKERTEKFNECIYVISHRKESIKSVTGDVVYLIKENGITRRIDYKEI